MIWGLKSKTKLDFSHMSEKLIKGPWLWSTSLAMLFTVVLAVLLGIYVFYNSIHPEMKKSDLT